MKSQGFSETLTGNRSAERHRALLELNNAIITNLTEETLLGAICVALKSVIHFDQAGLSIYESEQQAMRLVALDGTSESYFKLGQLLPLRDPVTGLSWEFHRQQFHPDLEHEIHHPIDQRIYDGGNRSYICAPLVHQGQACGTLGIGSRRKNQYTRDDLEFLQEVANQIVLAMANMQSYAEIKTLSIRETAIAKRHRTLLEINNAIITCLTQEELLRSIGAALQRVTPFNQAGIYLYHPEKDVFRFFSLYRTDRVEPYIVEQELDPRDRVSGLVFARGQAVIRRDLETERQFSSEEHLYRKGVRSMCVAPLIAQGKTIGAIGLGSDVRNLSFAKTSSAFSFNNLGKQDITC